MCLFVYLDDIPGYIEAVQFGRYSGKQFYREIKFISESANLGLTLKNSRR
jgi:hypothetical protein